jgi:cell shape-determining protein MreD
MSALLIGIPIMLFAAILQSSLVSNFTLLSGMADLVLVVIIAWTIDGRVKYAWVWAALGAVFVSLFSALPFFVYVISYGLIAWIAYIFHRRIWQAPLLIMLGVTLLGTVIEQVLSMLILQLNGTPLSFLTGFTRVTLPSVLLNLLVALPIYAIFRYLAGKVYPGNQEE